MNKEIMEYREAMFFGLDFRQMVCSLLAIFAAVGIYFSLRGVAGDEVTGWLCMAGAAPFVFCGFFKYHGMTAEQFAWAFIKSEFLYPKKLVYKPEDIYYQCLENCISDGESGKKVGKENAKKSKKNNRWSWEKIFPSRSRAYRKHMKKRKQMEMKRRKQNRLELNNRQKGRLDSRQKRKFDSRQKKESDGRQRNQQKGRTNNRQKIHQKGRRIENRQKNRRDAID